jgi:autotransporter passenger strand-loop-strand repeat protein
LERIDDYTDLSSGVIVSGSTVSSGSFEIVLSGGSAVDTQVSSGGTFVFDGGRAIGLVVSSGRH